MSALLYLLSFFPNFGLRLSNGNLPTRYFSSIFIFALRRVRKVDLVLLLIGFVMLAYPLLFSWVRPFHGLDIAYPVFFLYSFVFIVIAGGNLEYFRRYIVLFWFINLIYSVLQNFALNLGLDSHLLMLHQNAHADSYVIPENQYIGGFYRVTGLFLESAPFVLFLALFDIVIKLLRLNRWIKLANLLLIFLAGAKVGYVFLFYLLIGRVNRFLGFRISLALPVVASGFMVLFFSSYLKDIVIYYDAYVGGLGSIWYRLDGLENVLSYFYSDFASFLFGYGHVSSMQLMSGDYLGPRRGNDFFSSFVLSNGIVGTLVFFFMIYYWIKKSANLSDVYIRNDFFIVALLMLMTIGSLQQFQYTLLLFLICLTGRIGAPRSGH